MACIHHQFRWGQFFLYPEDIKVGRRNLDNMGEKDYDITSCRGQLKDSG